VVLAFDVGGTSVKAAAVDADLVVLAEARRPSERGEAIVDVIAAAADDLRSGLRTEQRALVCGAGVAMPGLVDAERGVVVRAVNLDLEDLDVGSLLSTRLGLPLRIGHDVQAAAEAERRVGFPDAADPVVLIIGTGIAGVSYVDGRAVRGVSGQAGEFGHLVVRPGGPVCGCGARGCLEAVASAGAIARSYSRATGEPIGGALEVLARLSTDPRAVVVWDEAASALADGLHAICAVLAPGALVLGGGLAEAGSALVDPVTAHLRARTHVVTVPPISLATLGSRAGVIGAALLAFDQFAELT
jgi:glucokinase